MNVGDLVRAMEAIAPAGCAASWDNVGLLVGDEASPLKSVLLTIDCTPEVLNEARGGRVSAVVSYHPPIFTGQKRFVAGSVAHDAARDRRRLARRRPTTDTTLARTTPPAPGGPTALGRPETAPGTPPQGGPTT